MSSQGPIPGWGSSEATPPSTPPPAPSAAGSGAGGPTGKRPLWKSPKAWGIGIVVLLVLGAIGSLGDADDETTAAAPSATPEATEIHTEPPTTGTLTITSHRDGDTVETPSIVVSGIAPAGARVVRDISFASDEEVVADGNGAWRMEITLDEGLNELVFRVGDDRSTAQSVAVTLATTAVAASEPAAEEPIEEPTEEPIEEPTEEPTPEPTKTYATFDDGTWIVGDEIRPGTYRIREEAYFCYWARLKGFSGSLSDIAANANVNGYSVVTISKNDAGFESVNCGTWTKDLSRVTESRTSFGDGTFIVKTDIKPGTYRSSGGDTCYWARLKSFSGSLGSIIANGLKDGRAIVTIKSTDKGFQSSGCGEWKIR